MLEPEVEIEAALWAVRVTDEEFSLEDDLALQRWIQSDPRRLGAYARARAMLLYVDRAKALGPAFNPDLYVADHGMPDDLQREKGPASKGRGSVTRRRFLIGGSLVAATSAASLVTVSWQAAAATYSTGRGEVRRVPLNDGSSMTLNTETLVVVHYTNRERAVRLIGGEVLFDVVRDPVRPFILDIGRSRISSASTSFAVRKRVQRSFDLTVREGRIALFPEGAYAAGTTIAANTRATLSSGGLEVKARKILPNEIDRELAWREGMLSFQDTPLADATVQFARYSDVAVTFEDPSVARETVTGLYAANDPRGFCRSVALSLGLTVSEQSGVITLHRQRSKNLE